MRKTGTYEIIGSTKYFIPYSLPPKDPALLLSPEILKLESEAMYHLGKLDEMIQKLPDVTRFIKAYVIKEALLSSEIEGIHTTMLDVMTQPLSEEKPTKETQLVLNYTKALDEAFIKLKNEGLPLTSRILLSTHQILMENGENDKANPGNYRRQSVKVGNLIPPPPGNIADLISNLEKFINENNEYSPLIKAGLAHVQFETIHPFLDGNGRIGRLLIVLMLAYENVIQKPIIYPSYYFKQSHSEYYHRLDRVRTHGDFEGWITFYLNVIKKSSIDAYLRAHDIEKLNTEIMHTILNKKEYSKMNDTLLNALSVIFTFPIITVNDLSKQLDMSYNTAHNVINIFIELDILVQITDQKRGNLFQFKRYFKVLEHEYGEIK